MTSAIPAADAYETGPLTAGSSQPFGEVVDERTRDARFDNQPPLEDRVMLEFEEDLDKLGIKARIEQLLESAAKCPTKIEDQDTAGKAGDLCKLSRVVEQKIDEAREKHNRPLINARTALKNKADSLFLPLSEQVAAIRLRLNAFVAEQERKRREEERLAQEAARKAQEEAQRAARESSEETGLEVPAPVVVAPPPPPRPVARGDLGARVGGRTVWKHERQVPIAKLPKSILENAQVIEAVDKVISSMVRAGTREIKGVRIFETTEAAVR